MHINVHQGLLIMAKESAMIVSVLIQIYKAISLIRHDDLVKQRAKYEFSRPLRIEICTVVISADSAAVACIEYRV